MIRFIPRRYWAVIAVALALTMSVLDGTIVNVALPTLSVNSGHPLPHDLDCQRLSANDYDVSFIVLRFGRYLWI